MARARGYDSDSGGEEGFAAESNLKSALTQVPHWIKLAKAGLSTVNAEKAKLSDDKILPFLTESIKSLNIEKQIEMSLQFLGMLNLIESKIDKDDLEEYGVSSESS